MKGTANDPGLIPSTLRKLFEAHPESKVKRAISAKMAYYEIYNESINDLLDSSKSNLEIREDKDTGVFVKDLTTVDVHDYSSALAVFERGEKNRTYASTDANLHSSRSHCIVQLDLEVRNLTRFEREIHTSIVLADLAGSECLEKTKTKGKNTREGSMINKSLLALSNVISKLSRREDYVGFRESKLTRILQPALTGNVMVSVICTVNPLRANLQESINTLKFGTCAGVIKKKLDVPPTGLDSKVTKEVFMELDELSNRLGEANDKIMEKDQSLCLMQLSVDELQTSLDLANNEKKFYEKDISRLQSELKKVLADNSKLINKLDEIEVKIGAQKEAEFRYMFDQQSLLIKSLEDEIESLKNEKESNYREALKQREVIPCMRRQDNSNKPAKTEASSSSNKILVSEDQMAKQGKSNSDFIEKLRVELESVKAKLTNNQKELIKQEKINRQLRNENEALRKELEENNQFSNRPRKAVKTFIPQTTFDRNGDPIEKKVTMSPSKDELKITNKQLEARTKKLEQQRDQSLNREEKCNLKLIRFC